MSCKEKEKNPLLELKMAGKEVGKDVKIANYCIDYTAHALRGLSGRRGGARYRGHWILRIHHILLIYNVRRCNYIIERPSSNSDAINNLSFRSSRALRGARSAFAK